MAGHDLVMTRDEYSVRAFWPNGKEVCFVNLHETFRSEPSFIVLGTTFMKKYQTIFDAGKREIDCELYDPIPVPEHVEIDSKLTMAPSSDPCLSPVESVVVSLSW